MFLRNSRNHLWRDDLCVYNARKNSVDQALLLDFEHTTYGSHKVHHRCFCSIIIGIGLMRLECCARCRRNDSPSRWVILAHLLNCQLSPIDDFFVLYIHTTQIGLKGILYLPRWSKMKMELLSTIPAVAQRASSRPYRIQTF